MATHTSQDLLVLGLKDQGVQPRKSITKLSDEELYLLVEGLARFQAVDPNDQLSFYQIAGIHGAPYTLWGMADWYNDPNIELNTGSNGQLSGGFCTHNSILFLTWHRPYLALFETQLYRHVNKAAQGLDQKYIDAAAKFRLPYWDWAQLSRPTDSVFPEAALHSANPSKPPSSSPPGTSPVKSNSLFASLIPQGFPATVPDGAKMRSTRRDPFLEENMKNVYKNYTGEAVSSSIPSSNLTERVGYILRSYKRFKYMSTNGTPAEIKDRTDHAEIWGSLEDIHNAIHGNVGGSGGTMSSIPTSAFDPIFWLHHANIDRLFAIWEVAHEKVGVAETFIQEQDPGFTTIIKRATETKDTPLYPFRKQSGWYTSNDAKHTEDFGYCYPETATKKTPAEMIQDMVKLYPTAADQLMASRRGLNSAGIGLLGQAHIMSKLVATEAPATAEVKEQLLQEMPSTEALLAESWKPEKPLLKTILDKDKYQEWLVNIKAERHTLGGKYRIVFFLGPVQEENVERWSLSPTFVGTFDPLGQEQDTGCANCQNQQENHLQITGQIPLTLALYERYLAAILPNLDVPTVTDYLAKNLHWRVVLDGQVVADRSQVAGLTVFVVTNEVTLPEDPNQLPVYAPDVVIHAAATTRPDGSGRGEGTGLSEGEVPQAAATA